MYNHEIYWAIKNSFEKRPGFENWQFQAVPNKIDG